ncbi:hypothetical protein X975_08482, partial [Stegodyphus mimosarum]
MKAIILFTIFLGVITLGLCAPFENYFQTFKNKAMEAAGGDSNPAVKAMDDFMEKTSFNERQKNFHDESVKLMEQATGETKTQFENMIKEFSQMQERGAEEEEYTQLFEKYKSVMQQMAQQ